MSIDTDSPRRLGPRGAPRPTPTIAFDGEPGPAMAKLNHRQRAFVISLWDGKTTGSGVGVEAAICAGYGTTTSTRNSLRVIASRLMADPKIQDAMSEVGKHYIGSTAIIAFRAAKNLLNDPSHKDHARACGWFLDRYFPQVVEQKIDVVHHSKRNAEMEELARRFALELGIPVERVLGVNRAKMIEGTATETNSVDARVNADDEQPENDEGN